MFCDPTVTKLQVDGTAFFIHNKFINLSQNINFVICKYLIF